VSGLAPVLDDTVEAVGIVGHDAIDASPHQGAEVFTVVNRPDNEAHAGSGKARGVDRIAPPEFSHEKIPP